MNYFERITEGFRLKIKECVSDNNSALQVKVIVSLSFKTTLDRGKLNIDEEKKPVLYFA